MIGGHECSRVAEIGEYNEIFEKVYEGRLIAHRQSPNKNTKRRKVR